MIKYTVRCGRGHDFEGWFKDSATYDAQAKAGQIACPRCGDTAVRKAPMAPRIAKNTAISEKAAERRAREVAREIVEAAAKIRKHVEDNCDYVGDQFADEARRIHYGEADERGIYGETTPDEAVELDEEGIEVYPLPPVRRNS